MEGGSIEPIDEARLMAFMACAACLFNKNDCN